jgi:hypothetical protein
MPHATLNKALSTIWTTILSSAQTGLDSRQERHLDNAISVVESSWPPDDPERPQAAAMCSAARQHMAAVLGIPQRKPKGTDALLEEVERLQRHLGGKA